MFHNIKNEGVITSPYEITKKDFEFFINKIDKKHVINISELHIKKSNKFLDQIILTFDDGYESIFTDVYPIMKKYNIPFTIFISLSLLNIKGYLNEKQLQILSEDELCTIGSHGIDHFHYRTLSKKNCENQLIQSKLMIEKIINKKIELFAFPYGDFYSCSISNVLVAKRSSYKYVFSTIPERISNSPLIKTYFLPRINVTTDYINKLY